MGIKGVVHLVSALEASRLIMCAHDQWACEVLVQVPIIQETSHSSSEQKHLHTRQEQQQQQELEGQRSSTILCLAFLTPPDRLIPPGLPPPRR
jgi:hypothetical protein